MPTSARVVYARNTPPPPAEELEQQHFSDISSTDEESHGNRYPEEAPVPLSQLVDADEDESYDESYNPSYNSYQSDDDDDVYPTPLEELLASFLEQQNGREAQELDAAIDSAMEDIDSAPSPEIVTIESSEEEEEEEEEEDDDVIEISSNPKGKNDIVDLTEENLKASQPEGLTERKRLNTFSCPVCMDEAEKIVVTPCGHLYCSDCVFRALSSTSHATESKGECSICRRGVMYKRLTYLELKCG